MLASPAVDEIDFRPNHRRAQLAVIMLGVCALISVMLIAFSLAAMALFQRLDSG